MEDVEYIDYLSVVKRRVENITYMFRMLWR